MTRASSIVYGNPSVDQWTPLLAAFNEKYPWIQVETFDLGGAEAFQRYLSEEATGSPTADVIVNTDGAGWLDLVERGKVVDYVDPELAAYPVDEAVLAPGVFAMSYDPLIAAFNTLAFPLDEQPTSLAEMAAMAPEISGQIGTVNVTNANAGLGTYGYIDAYGEEGWAVLEQLGPHSGVEDGTGALLGKLQSGEYIASFFASRFAAGADRHDRDRRPPQLPVPRRRHDAAGPRRRRHERGGVAERGAGARQLPPVGGGPDGDVPRWLHPVPRGRRLPDRAAGRRGGGRRGQRDPRRLPGRPARAAGGDRGTMERGVRSLTR